IIAILNEQLKGEGQKAVIILDIFGFENFQKNSLEQFFINYANESLQGLFTTNTMKREEELYKREGIPWENVKYSDNIDIIKLIENNLLPTLGDTCMKTHAIREGSGRAFAQDIAGFNGAIMTSDMNQMSIKHYTVKVSYTLEDFANKNREGIRKPIIDMLQNSTNNIVKQVTDLSASNNQNADPKKAMSSKRIRNDIDYIREKFDNCELTYVRCIKSTNELKGDTFDETLVAKQVQDLGLPPTALVFSKTFVLHAPFLEFARRYALLVGEKLPSQQKAGDSGKFKDICERIMKVVVKGDSKEYVMGKTMIFVRTPETNESLLDAKMVKINQLVSSIQTEMRKLNVIVDETSENQKLAELLRSKERHNGIFEVPEIHPKLVSLETIGDCSKHLKRKEKVLGTFLLKKYPRTFKENKCSFWWLVVTNIGALMFRKRVSKDNSIQTELVARLAANDIVSIEVSCLKDRFCLFKFAAGLKIEPLLFHVNFLPNLLWILGDKLGMQSKIMFSNELNYELKALKGFVGSIANKIGGLNMQLKFTKTAQGADSSQGAGGSVKGINASSKSTQIQVTGGIPAGSTPKPIKVKRN
ncbi:MAG: Unconventional myosin-Ie, partial [Marteilia pararefringens]